MPKRRHTDIWIAAVRRWLGGMEGPGGEQLVLPNMPEPPRESIRRLVPFVLVTFADHDGTSCRPTRAYIARIAGCSPDTIQRTTVELEQLGLLHRVNRAHRGEAQEWALTLPDWLSGTHRKGRTSAPLSEPNGTQRHPRKGRTSAPPPSSSKKMTSSDVVGGAERPPANTADEVPAWAPPDRPDPMRLTTKEAERNQRRIAEIRDGLAAAKAADTIADGRDLEAESRRQQRELRDRYPDDFTEVSEPLRQTDTHARS